MRKLLTTAVFTALLHFAAFSQCSQLKLSVDKKFQCAPGIVNFKLSGAPTGSSFLWDFGKGYVANTDTVHEFYLHPQTVNVRVKVTFPGGNSCVVAENSIAQILGKPNPSFEISRKKLCDGPDTVTLINTTPHTQSISWIVDGTNYANSTNTLVHRFSTTGSKNVYQVITDSFGCSNVKEHFNVAQVHADVSVDFYADQTSGCVTKNVQFTGSVNAFDEKVQTYHWKFEGANIKSSNKKNPPKLTYVKPGKFGAALMVTTTNGCKHEMEKKDYLHFGDSLPLNIEVEDSILCLKNQTTVKVKNPGSGTYIWLLAGSPDTVMVSNTEIKTKYNTPGDYDISLLLNDAGCFSVAKIKNAVRVKDVQARFSSNDNYHCFIPHTTHIKNQSSAYNNEPLTYQWKVLDIADNVIRKENGKKLTYASKKWGRYSIELIASDQYGCKDTMFGRQFIRVDSIRPTISKEEKIGCVNQLITLRHNTPASSYMSGDSFYWVVYDLDGKTIYNQGKGPYIDQKFSKPGFYDVKLFAGNTIGCKDTLKADDFIHIIEPKIDFEISDPTICNGTEVEITAKTTPVEAPFTFGWEVYQAGGKVGEFLQLDTAKTVHVKLDRMGPYHVKYIHQINNGCRDSMTKFNAVDVNGLSGTIEVDKDNGCLPMNVAPRFNTTANVHVGHSSDALSYSWSILPNEGATIDDLHAKNPKISITKKGAYTIYVHAENSAGCGVGNKSTVIYAGVEASFELNQDSICAFEELYLKNTSAMGEADYTWTVHTNGKYALELDTNHARFTPKSNEVYTIELIASKENTCFDTMSKTLQSIIVQSGFELADTHLFCAPAYAQFNTFSVNADTFFWDFGDDSKITTTDKQIANIYNRNTGFNDGFDVSLISKSYLGCADTLTRDNFVKVFGPVPDFEVVNPVGCEPLEVGFVNKSTSVKDYFFNFDDNTQLDSTQKFDKHVYHVLTTNLRQTYIPSLYVRDSLGCAAVYESPDTVVVLKSPTAVPSDGNFEGCSPVQVALNDESQRITSRSWLLNGTEISRETSINPSLSQTGNHTIQLVVTNSNNCSDTSTFAVQVHENPVVNFSFTQVPCLNEKVMTVGHTLNNTTVTDWVWSINNLAILDTTKVPAYDLTINQSGKYVLNLTAITPEGCAGSFDSSVVVRGIDDIPQGEITYVTVNDMDEIEVHWSDIDPEFLSHTTVYDNGSQQVLYKGVINQESMIRVNYADLKESHCFSLSHTNNCGDEGRLSISHCPIILNVTPGENFALNLDWTTYTGWNGVDKYVIYRSEDGISFNEIAEVDASTLQYTDKLLCDQYYCYQIEAVYAGLSSRSNKDKNKPLYDSYKLPLDVAFATIENNEEVYVEWEKAKTAYPVSYLLNTYDAEGLQLLNSVELTQTSYTEDNIDVSAENYVYKVQTLDHCGVKGIEGYQGKPMLLTGYYANDVSQLQWSAYEEWDEGVDFYDIQILDNGEFVSVGTVPGGQTAYTDKEFHDEINGDYIYRIVAISFTPGISSTSNHLALRGASFVWIPNAFSPNEDDHNPVFKPTPQFVYLVNDGTYRAYEMKIFNRWGEEIFVTNNVDEGWDGTYKNKDCESEVYLYHIRVTGLDRAIYDKKGLVRLMR